MRREGPSRDQGPGAGTRVLLSCHDETRNVPRRRLAMRGNRAPRGPARNRTVTRSVLGVSTCLLSAQGRCAARPRRSTAPKRNQGSSPYLELTASTEASSECDQSCIAWRAPATTITGVAARGVPEQQRRGGQAPQLDAAGRGPIGVGGGNPVCTMPRRSELLLGTGDVAQTSISIVAPRASQWIWSAKGKAANLRIAGIAWLSEVLPPLELQGNDRPGVDFAAQLDRLVGVQRVAQRARQPWEGNAAEVQHRSRHLNSSRHVAQPREEDCVP